MHIGWLVLECVLGVWHSTVVVFVVSSCRFAGVVAEIIVITIVSVFILIVRIIILTFIIRIPYVGFIDLKILIIIGDVNLVNLIHPPYILMVCFVRMRGSKFIAFSKAACRDLGRSWLNLPSISSPNFPYSELAYWIHCVLDPASLVVMPGYPNRKCESYQLLYVCKASSGFCWIELKA